MSLNAILSPKHSGNILSPLLIKIDHLTPNPFCCQCTGNFPITKRVFSLKLICNLFLIFSTFTGCNRANLLCVQSEVHWLFNEKINSFGDSVMTSNGKPSIVLENHEKLFTKLLYTYIVINIYFCLLYCTYIKQIVRICGPL